MQRDQSTGIAGVIDQLRGLLETLDDQPQGHRAFLATYLRTTRAVDDAVRAGRFEDPEWVEEWDAVFARLYVDALLSFDSGGRVPRPWRVAFEASAELHDLFHVLLGVNAHINYDLPQSLLAMISPADFEDLELVELRRRDHERIDGVLSSRVGEEGRHFDDQRLSDRLLTPLNRAASKRFLREARRRVWHNTQELHLARLHGPEAYAVRLAELEVLSAAKVDDLLQPGPVLLRLAVGGFGVTLPPPAPPHR